MKMKWLIGTELVEILAMNNKPSLKSVTLAGLITALFSFNLVAEESFIREIIESYTVSQGQELLIDVSAADIQVEPGTSDEVSLTLIMSIQSASEEEAEKAFEQMNPQFIQDDAGVKLILKPKKRGVFFGLFDGDRPSAKILATCPASFDLNLDTGSGKIRITSVDGDHVLDTGSGSIHIANMAGNISADTGSGSIRAENISGELLADTGSGSVDVENLDGDLIADTGSGSINARNVVGSFVGDTGSGSIRVSGVLQSFKADTGSGNIHIVSSSEISADSTADAGSGSIEVVLPTESAFHLQASTGRGSISCDFPNQLVQSKEDQELRASVNGGGPLLKLESNNGQIQVTGNAQ